MPTLNWNIIGEKIRMLRLSKGITQAELAELSGIDRSLISRAENNHIVLPLGMLSRIAEVLEISLLKLLEGLEESSSPEIQIIRASDCEIIQRETSEEFGYAYYQILSTKNFAVIKIEVSPRQNPPQLISHREMEFGYVIKGHCSLYVQETKYDLELGVSYWINGVTPHLLVSDEEDSAVLALFVNKES